MNSEHVMKVDIFLGFLEHCLTLQLTQFKYGLFSHPKISIDDPFVHFH